MLSQRKYSEVLARVTNSSRPPDLEAQLLAIRGDALSELAYLLNDNVDVVTSPPGPDAGTPPH